MASTKGRKFPAEPLTREEMLAIAKIPSKQAPTGIRNRALLYVLWRAGLRISEALSLETRDMDAAYGTIRVREGKGRKARVVGMDVVGFAAVEKWHDRRHADGIESNDVVFCTLAGRKLSRRYVEAMLGRLAVRAGITKRVHPHGLRHTFACELADEGVHIREISKLLGHASIATTAGYLDHLNPQQAIDAARNRTL